VLEGEAASEHALKALLAGHTSVLHLATHARADAAFPDRSAVFLAPGADGEDGWFQPPEIAALQLGRALVVLSACESAGGQRVAGEGVLSLARAFFAGGAGTVIATRWPLRDDDAAFVMERFYRALATGATVGGAMQRARLDSLTAGLPAAAWAGFALLGDDSGAPVPTETPAAPRRWWLLVVVGLIAIAAWLARRVVIGS
jgi:CHAT domain-containing protein